MDPVAAHRCAEQRHMERRVGKTPDRIVVEERGHLRPDRDFSADVEEDRSAAEHRPARAQRIADQRADRSGRCRATSSPTRRAHRPARQKHEDGQDGDDSTQPQVSRVDARRAHGRGRRA